MHRIERTSRHIITCISLGILLLLTGCLEVDAVVTLNKDGSGKVVITEIITGDGRDRLIALSKDGSIPNIDIEYYLTDLNKRKLAKRAEEISTGIKFTSVKPVNLHDGGIGRETVYTFEDINKVRFFNTSSENTDNLSFSYTGSELKIQINITPKEEKEILQASRSLGMIPPMLKKAFEGMKLKVILNTAEEISGTTALYIAPNNRCITFIDLNIGKLIATPDAINKLIRFNSETPENLQQSLQSYQDWLKVETAKEITVSF